jgi:RNA polymerase sigma factor (sigma-70 family)
MFYLKVYGKAMHKNEKSNKDYWQLYKSFCKGNQRASHELVNDIGNRLMNYLLRSCVFGNYQEAEECLQITWEKLWKYCGKPLNEEKGFWGFTSTIAQRVAIDRWRINNPSPRKPIKNTNTKDEFASEIVQDATPKDFTSNDNDSIEYGEVVDTGEDNIDTASPRSRLLPEDEIDSTLPRGTFVTPEDDYEDKQKFKIFKSMMLSLKPDDRVVMDLHLREYTNEQIAQMTGKHEQAIKTQIRTIRGKLYDTLHPESRG